MNRIISYIDEIIDNLKKIKKLEEIDIVDLEKFRKVTQEKKPVLEKIDSMQIKLNQEKKDLTLATNSSTASKYVIIANIQKTEKELAWQQSILKQLEQSVNSEIPKIDKACVEIKKRLEIIKSDLDNIEKANTLQEILVAVGYIREFIAEINKIIERVTARLHDELNNYSADEHVTMTKQISNKITYNIDTYKELIKDEIQKIDKDIKKLEELEVLEKHIDKNRIVLSMMGLVPAGMTVIIDTNQMVKLYEEYKNKTDNINLPLEHKLRLYLNVEGLSQVRFVMPEAVIREEKGIAKEGIIGIGFATYVSKILKTEIFNTSEEEKNSQLANEIIQIWLKTIKAKDKVQEISRMQISSEEKQKNPYNEAIKYFLKTADFEICHHVLKNNLSATILTEDTDIIEILSKMSKGQRIKFVKIAELIMT